MDNRASRKLPLILSSEAAECGLACIVMVANALGHDIDLPSLRRRHSVSLAGLTVRGMVDICSNLGLASRPVRAELDELPLLKTPAILHWDLNHFVVLKSATAKRIVIHDPSGGARGMTLSEASSHFTGVAVELSPVADFQGVPSRQSVRLSSLWSESRGILSAALQVIGLSVVLQLLTFAMPFQVQLAVDEAIGNGDAPFITVLALGFAGVIVLRTGVDFLRSWLLQIFTASSAYQVIGNIVSPRPRLTAVRYQGQVAATAGNTLTRFLSADDVRPLRLLLASTDVLSLPPDSCLSGVDGVVYLIEATGPDGYRFINRWGVEDGPVYEVANEMYRLTGWPNGPQGLDRQRASYVF